jgi:hypothetical protein
MQTYLELLEEYEYGKQNINNYFVNEFEDDKGNLYLEDINGD